MSTFPIIDQPGSCSPPQEFDSDSQSTAREEVVWLDGRFLRLPEARIPIEDRGLQFGDGIYEVLIAYDGSPFLIEEHLHRWEKSAEGLGIIPRIGREERQGIIHKLVKDFGAHRTLVYGQLTRGTARRTHNFPASPQPMELWYARELPAKPPHFYSDGVAAVTHPDERWKHVWIKSTCLLPNCMAKEYAVQHNAFDAILFSEGGTVTESSAANVFAIKDKIVHTHPTNGRILAGATRGLVLDLARAAGIKVCEEPFSREFLGRADEVFLTSTTLNVLPVTTLDSRPLANGKVGPITQQLMLLVGAEIRKRTGR